MANGHHRGINETDARAATKGGKVQEEHHLEEHTALKFHEAVVRNRIREIGPQVLPDEEQVVVPEIAERAELEHDKDGHYLTVGKRGLTVAAVLAIGGHTSVRDKKVL